MLAQRTSPPAYSVAPVSLAIDSEPTRFSLLALAVAAAIGLALGVGLGLGIGAAVDRPLPEQSVLAAQLDEARAEMARLQAVADRLPGVEKDLAATRAKGKDLEKRVEQLREIKRQAIADRDRALAKQTELADKVFIQENVPGKRMLMYEHGELMKARQEIKNQRQRLAREKD